MILWVGKTYKFTYLDLCPKRIISRFIVLIHYFPCILTLYSPLWSFFKWTPTTSVIPSECIAWHPHIHFLQDQQLQHEPPVLGLHIWRPFWILQHNIIIDDVFIIDNNLLFTFFYCAIPGLRMRWWGNITAWNMIRTSLYVVVQTTYYNLALGLYHSHQLRKQI